MQNGHSLLIGTASRVARLRLRSDFAFWSHRIELIWIRHESDSGAALGQTSNIIGRMQLFPEILARKIKIGSTQSRTFIILSNLCI